MYKTYRKLKSHQKQNKWLLNGHLTCTVLEGIQYNSPEKYKVEAPHSRLGIVKGITNRKYCWWWRRGSYAHSWWECELVELLWKIVSKTPRQVKSESPQETVTTLFGTHKELIKSVCLIKFCTFRFIKALFIHNNQNLQSSQMALNWWVEKMWYLRAIE